MLEAVGGASRRVVGGRSLDCFTWNICVVGAEVVVSCRVARFGFGLVLPKVSSMMPTASSMSFYGIDQVVYEIETGFYDIEVGVYEINGQVYEIESSL